MKEWIRNQIQASIEIKQACLNNSMVQQIERMGDILSQQLLKGHKIFLFGNGGSAADAQHLAAELIGRFESERPGLAAIALTTNTSNLTAIGNDYGFNSVYARQLYALGQSEDIAIGLSTSGNSINVITALQRASKKGLICFGWTGKDHCQMDEICDQVLHIPSHRTANIQEGHMMVGHILCGIIENRLSAQKNSETPD